MGLILYNIFLLLFKWGVRIASIWNEKAKKWVKGRENIFDNLKTTIGQKEGPLVWMHCSSLGEFEQGRPLVEKLSTDYPHVKLLLSFFSPSGFEIQKNYKGADWIFYLPMDSRKNAKKFLDIVNPTLAIFIKYDFWYYYLRMCKKRKIPLLMVSAIFRKEQPFFKWYGGFHRHMLSFFSYFFVQDENSKKLLQQINIHNVSVAGDTRFDRVATIAGKFEPIDLIESFSNGSKVLVAGSTWPIDEKSIKEACADITGLKIILAPHEIDNDHIEQINALFPDAFRYSQLASGQQDPTSTNILIIDNIGMLSRLYHYATIAYIGGGFNNGIHNTLEAAVYGKPVLFGPKYHKFREAIGLINAGGGFSIGNAAQLKDKLKQLSGNSSTLRQSAEASLNYVKHNTGATEMISGYIQENRLLTN